MSIDRRYPLLKQPAHFDISDAEKVAQVTVINDAYPPVDARRYGALVNSVADDTAALNTGIKVAAQTVGGAAGAAVTMPTGTSLLSSLVLLPNRVRIAGQNKLGSYFQATPGWAVGNGTAAWSAATNYVMGNVATQGGVLYTAKQASLNQAPPNATYWNPISNAMFYAQNGYSLGPSPPIGTGLSMFDSRLENVTVDANNVAGLGCILSSAWQENSGLRGALLLNFTTYGIKFQDGFGGAALCKIVDAEMFGAAGAIGIDLSTPIGGAAGFTLDVSNTTITGSGSSGNLVAGISVKGNSLCCRQVHFEVTNIGVLVDGNGYITLDNLTGSTTVTSLVTIAATFTGSLEMRNCRRNGATNFVNDLRAGGYGAITGGDEPYFVVNAGDPTSVAKGSPFASAWCVFDGTVAGTNPPAAGYNVQSVTRNSTGNYTITLLRAMLSASAAAVAAHNITNSGAQVTTQLITSTTVRVVVGVSGVATDTTEVKMIVFGG